MFNKRTLHIIKMPILVTVDNFYYPNAEHTQLLLSNDNVKELK